MKPRRSPGRRDHITNALLQFIHEDGRTVVDIAAAAGVPRSTIAMAQGGGHYSFGMWTAIALAEEFGFELVLRRKRRKRDR